MVQFLYVITLLLVALLTYQRFHSLMRINFYFSSIWLIFAFFSSIGIIGLVPASPIVNIAVLTVVGLFNFVYLLFSPRKVIISRISKKINYNLLLVINIFAYLLFIPILFPSIRMLLAGYSLSYIRSYLYIIGNFSDYEKLFFRNTPIAIFDAVTIVSIIDIVITKSGKKLTKILPFINVFISVIALGGRATLMKVLFALFVLLGFKSLKKLSKKSTIVIMTLTIAGLIFVTYLRDSSGITLIENVFLYYSGSLSHLTVIMQTPGGYGLNESLTYGYLMLGPITEPLALALKFFFRFDIEVPSYYINSFVQVFVNIGATRDVMFNNNTTMLFAAIKDFGYLGFAVYPVFLSVILVSIERLLLHSKNVVLYLSFFLLISISLLDTIINYNFISTSYIIIVAVFLSVTTSVRR